MSRIGHDVHYFSLTVLGMLALAKNQHYTKRSSLLSISRLQVISGKLFLPF